MDDALLVIHGKQWNAKQLSVSMAFDALRLSLGGNPSIFTPDEIVLWLSCIAKQHRRVQHG